MKKLILFAAIFILGFSSCKKEVTTVQQVNQAFSAIYTIKASNWSTTNGGQSYTVDIPVPEVDNTIYQNGAVLVFLSFPGTSYYEALPEVFDGLAYGVIHSPGYVGIDCSSPAGGIVNAPSGDITAKIVLIDAAALSVHKGVNLNDLSAVKSAFNVQ